MTVANVPSNEDTIVAIATPLGEGGLGVVRLSGPKSIAIADRLFQFQNRLQQAASHSLHHGWVHSSSGPLDEAVAALFRSPHSYTGDDVVEISSHGSPVVLKKIVELCENVGARPARPGEFTLRAYLNGKMDLAQAEAVADLIRAKSDRARGAAVDQLRGVLSERLKKLREPLVTLLAQVEANMDFVEEDIPLISREQITTVLLSVDKEMTNLLSTAARGRWLREGVKVTLAGKPNVGKSSLFNALLSQDRAIVTDVPGTTRDILEEQFEWGGVPFILSDTAGLRNTDDPVESAGNERAHRAHASADIVLAVVDGTAPLSADDKRLLSALEGRRAVIVINKSDRPLKFRSADLRCLWSVVEVSAKTGQGLSELKELLLKNLATDTSESESSFLTNERHVNLIEKSREHIQAAIQAIQAGGAMESASVDLRQAIKELSTITGEDSDEDVLDSIFRQFCIGK